MNCYGCKLKDQDIKQLKAENASLRQTIGYVKRAIQGLTIESLDELGSLDINHATRLLVLEALDRTQGDRALAAKLLGVARSTLFEYLKRYGIKDGRSRIRELRKFKPTEVEYVQLS